MSAYTFKHDRFSSHNQIIDAIDAGASVLDVGCGRGLLSSRLAEKGCKVIGVDGEKDDRSFSQNMEKYIQHDLESGLPPVGENVFDYVIAADVLEHIRSRARLLNDIAHCLKPGGTLIASTGNITLFVYRMLLLIGRFEYRDRGILDRDHVHLFTPASFAAEIATAGFCVFDRLSTPIPFELVFSAMPSSTRMNVVNQLTAVYQIFARMWPSMFAYQVIIKARFRAQQNS